MRDGDWIETYLGVKFYPLDPKPEEIYLEDIAHALSLNCRFNGHSLKFYSVAEHSINVYKGLKELGYNKKIQLYGLLHDASEAYICDIPRPIKSYINNYKKIEKNLQNTIWLAFELPIPTKEEYEYVKNMDNIILGHEGKVLMNNIDNWTNHMPIYNLKTIDWNFKNYKKVRYDFIILAKYLLNEYKEIKYASNKM